MLRTDDFSYELPAELIAQTPAEPRDSSRLMVLDEYASVREHATFKNLPRFLRAGDVLVANRSKVFPARLTGRLPGGGRAELLLLRPRLPGVWEALARPGRRLRAGRLVELSGGAAARIDECLEEGRRVVRFEGGEEGERLALEHGLLPLPPYIRSWQGDPGRYQTVYADQPGSVAAPTAGLHFTAQLFEALRASGVEVQFLTLHVGLDTFRPVLVQRAGEHRMHAEYYELSAETVAALRSAKRESRRIIGVGTTVARTLESVSESILDERATQNGSETGLSGWTRLFILPGFRFNLLDGLITNFHLPRSTLLMLVSAFIGRERLLSAYAEAAREQYRFYTFGDAMLAWRVDS